MGRNYRRMAVGAMGALLAPAAVALITASLADADAVDDLAYLGPFAIGGYTETLTYNTSSHALDNFLTGSSSLIPFQLDLSLGAPGSGDFGVLYTIPGLYQSGVQDINGVFTPIFSFDAASFLNADNGLIELGGTPPASQLVETIGPIAFGPYTDYVSLNTETLAFDNFLTVAASANALPFEIDIFSGAPGADSSEFLLTIPSLVQVGWSDIGGAITPIFPLTVADFINPDVGLSAIGGIAGL